MIKITKDKRNKIILVAMVTLVAIGALWFLLIDAQRGALTKARAEADKSRAQLENGERTVKSQAAQKEEYERASQALRQRESVMATPGDMYLWHIETLNKFRLGYKVEIPQFGRETMAEVGSLPKFPYSAAVFNVRGSAHFHEFGKFLADFENSHPCMRVQNLTLEPASGELASGPDGREKLTFKMELLTLVRPNSTL